MTTESIATTSTDPVAFASAIVQAEALAAKVRIGHPTIAIFEDSERRFWDSLAGRPIEEQAVLVDAHCQELGTVIVAREQERLDGIERKRQLDEFMRERARERHRRAQFAAEHAGEIGQTMNVAQGELYRLSCVTTQTGSPDELSELVATIRAVLTPLNAALKVAEAKKFDDQTGELKVAA